MHLRLILARVVSAICLVAVLTLGPQAAQGSLENLRHSLRGDVVASDGGWIIESCDAIDSQCAVGAGGDAHGDGHHHHGAEVQAVALLPTATPMAVALVRVVETSPPLNRQLDDADPGRLGHVPRASIRLS